jgi:hypothetical protein
MALPREHREDSSPTNEPTANCGSEFAVATDCVKA